jgi:hypothetical protein
VFRELSTEALGKAQKTMAWFVKQGNPPPMVFTQDEIETSNDVFPIEFLDMQCNHQVLYGEDILKDLEIRRDNHRLELEHELRAKFVGLRQNFLASSQDAKAVKDLIFCSFSSFMALFRHVLMLLGEKAPLEKREIIPLIADKLGLDKSCFLRVLKAREEGGKLPAKEVIPLFESYLAQISKVINAVDQL